MRSALPSTQFQFQYELRGTSCSHVYKLVHLETQQPWNNIRSYYIYTSKNLCA